jgi:soluble lytic murein transglycosylase-like protein
MALFHPGVERWRKLVEKLVDGTPLSVNLVMAMVERESAGYEFAQSHAGARGLMQLMKGAVQDAGEDYETFDFWDPESNLRAGIEYMSQMMKRFKGDLALALAAYNSGPTRVARLKAIPPIKETQRYVKVITARVRWLDRKTEKLASVEEKPKEAKAKHRMIGRKRGAKDEPR